MEELDAKVRKVDYFADEYIVGVSNMTFEEQGVYWMICNLIISQGGPIPYDVKWIAKLGNTRPSKVEKIISRLLSVGKLTEKDSKLCQKRAESALKAAQNRIKNAQEVGKKGGRPRKENNDLKKGEGYFPENLTTNKQQPTSNKQAAREGNGNQVASVHGRLCEIVGADPAKDIRWADWHVVQQWLNEGYDPERDIYPIVQRRMATGAKPKSAGYFTEAIREAKAKAVAQAPLTPNYADTQRATRRARLKVRINQDVWKDDWNEPGRNMPTIDEAKAELAGMEGS